MNVPQTILIKSDANELTFVEKRKDGAYVFKYSKSISKKNQLLTLSENDLIKLIKQNE